LIQFSLFGTVTFVFDDGYKSVHEKAYPLMRKYGFVGTVAITINYIGKENYLNKRQIKELHNYGWEIASHTVSHKLLTLAMLDGTFEEELLLSKQKLKRIIDEEITGLISPYGIWEPWVWNNIDKYYDYNRTTLFSVSKEPYKQYALKTFQIKNSTALKEIKDYLQRGKDDWTILTFHRIEKDKDRWSYSKKKFAELLKYIFRKGYKIKTIRQVLE